jgi:hypothetical protein
MNAFGTMREAIDQVLAVKSQPPLNDDELLLLFPHDNWSAVTCANMIVQRRRESAATFSTFNAEIEPSRRG